MLVLYSVGAGDNAERGLQLVQQSPLDDPHFEQRAPVPFLLSIFRTAVAIIIVLRYIVPNETIISYCKCVH